MNAAALPVNVPPTSRFVLQWLQFTRHFLPFPKLIMGPGKILGPALLLSLHNLFYQMDYFRSQTPEFLNTSHIEQFDFIVVGGGSAGSVLACRLSRHNTVLLLELGGDPNPLSYLSSTAQMLQRNPGTDLMYETVPQNVSAFAMKNNVVFWPRGTGLGGSSNLNFMVYQRGNPNDYNNWARITQNHEWSYEYVLPFFKKLESYHGIYPSEEYHGTGGPMHVELHREPIGASFMLKAAKEKGYSIDKDLNARQTEGFSSLELTTKRGLRFSTYTGYIEPVLHRKNLKIYRYSRVTKVHLDRSRHAYGVTYHRHGVKKFVRANKEIIISAGAVDSPKLLLLSGIGSKQQLHSVGIPCRVHLPGVGQNLQDHLFSFIGPFTMANIKKQSFLVPRDATPQQLLLFAHNGTGTLSFNGISSIGYISTTKNKNWPDLQILQTGLGVSDIMVDISEMTYNTRPDILLKYLSPHHGKDAHFVLQTLVRPKSIGEIKLKSNDPLEKPYIQPNYLTHPDDAKAMVEGMKIMVDIFENTTIYRSARTKLATNPFPGCEIYEFKSDNYYECFIRSFTTTLYHPAGTCAMGKNVRSRSINMKNGSSSSSNRINRRKIESSRASGNTTRHESRQYINYNKKIGPVVDSELRVYKTSGLRVMDTSIMPVLINANTNIPTIMIGEKGSYFIRNYWANQYLICHLLDYIRNIENQFCLYSRQV